MLPFVSQARVPENPVLPNVVCVKNVPAVSCSSMYTGRPLSGSSDTRLFSIVCATVD